MELGPPSRFVRCQEGVLNSGIMKILLLMFAGALGTGVRYGFSLWVQKWIPGWGARTFLGAGFPLGTLLVNVTGCFLLSVIVTLTLSGTVKPEWRLILGTGFLGAFTTFSTFELEAEQLLADAQYKAALVYILGNLILGFAAILLGRALANRVFGA
jgi:CrcB protein